MEFFDTNVLVYALDPSDPVRRPIALQLLRQAVQRQTLAISTQVMLEFYSTALRKKLMSGPMAVQLLQEWAENHVVASTPELLWRAFELQHRSQLSVWDATIVQAALDAGCHVLYTEDLQDGFRLGELEIVNPFLRPQAVHEPAGAYGSGRRKQAPST